MEIRVARVEDALAVETVRINTWKIAYRGLIPDSTLDALVVGPHRRRRGITSLLATEQDLPVGMAAFGPCRDNDRQGQSELYALYVTPGSWRSGIGTALLEACAAVTSLWVLEHNAQAQGFYARHGFAPDGVTKVLDLGGPVVEIRMVRS